MRGMDRRDARLALDLARQWNREGLLPASSLPQIESRYAEDARDDPARETFGSSVLYALGGVLLGAAVFAFLILLEQNGFVSDSERVAPWLFAAWGLVCLGAAIGVDLGLHKSALSESFYVASLVAMTAAGFPRGHELPVIFVSLAFALGVLAYRRLRFMLPTLALIAFNVAFAGLVWIRIERTSDEAAVTTWFLFALAQLATLTFVAQRTKWPWPSFGLASATLLLAGTFVAFYLDVGHDILSPFDGDIEVFLALLMGLVMAAGFVLREKGAVLSSALVIAIDSIVFAFDVGELVGGLIAILAVSGLLIWQAGSLRRYLRED